MDYQGNYFPEEQDENESKVYRNVKRVFKWCLYGTSFVVYAILIFLLFVNRNSDILETNYMTELSGMNEVDGDDIELYRINTRIFMNELGSLQLYSVDYAPEYGLLEVGVKFNAKKLTNEDYGDCLDYILTDSEGNSYKLVNKKTDSGGRYGFSRICFEGLDIDFKSNDLRYHDALNHSARPVLTDSSKLWTRSDLKYNLAIYRKSDGELLYDFLLYDNATTFNSTDYED